MFVLYVLFAISLAIFIAKWAFRKQINYIYPPGPWGLPYVGYTLQLANAPHLKHTELAGIYGDAHTVTTFGQKTVVLNSMEIVSQCNLENSDNFNHRPVWLKTAVHLGPGIVGKGVDEYKENRQFAMKNLKKHGMGKSEMEPRILQEVRSLMNFIDKNENIEAHSAIQIFSLNVISQLCFSRSWPYNNGLLEPKKCTTNAFLQAIHKEFQLFESLILTDYVPILKYLPKIKQQYAAMDKNANTIRKYGEEAIVKRQLQNDSTPNYDSADLVDDFLENHKYRPTKEDVRNFIDISQDMFESGTLTTAATLTYGLIQLIYNPDLQDELYSEMCVYYDDNILNESVTMSDIQHLPLTEAFIQEVIRMYPVAPLIFHATQKDTKLQKFYIPRNTMVLINAHCINNNSTNFQNPQKFNPKRWLDENKKFKVHMKQQMITFGKGRRDCIGKPLARMELFFAVVMLVRRYKLGVPKGTKLPSCEPINEGILTIPDSFMLKTTLRAECSV